MDRVCSRCAVDLYVKLVTKKGHQGTAVRLVRGAVHLTFDIKLSTMDADRLTVAQSFCKDCAPDGMIGFLASIQNHLQHEKGEPPRKKRTRPHKCGECRRSFSTARKLQSHQFSHQTLSNGTVRRTPLDRAQNVLTRQQAAALTAQLFDLGNLAAATGPALDAIGLQMGFTRGPSETDASFRTRQRYRLQTNPPIGSTIVGDIDALPHPPALPTDVVRPPRGGR